MKKDERKVVPFPGVKKRLIDKGMEAIKEKKFSQALAHFQEAEKWDAENSEVQLGKAISLLELGELKEAKEICKQMLHEDRGNYFTVLQIYLTILIQIGKYDEVQTTIEVVLEENKVPANYAEQFYKLLDFARKMNREDAETISEDELNLHNLLATVEEQVKFVHTLQQANCMKHMHSIHILLEHPNVHPVVKTMILQVLKDQEVFRKIEIHKFGKEMTVIPIELKDISEEDFVQRVLNKLEDYLSNENPTLYEALKDLWIRHLYVLYPFHPDPERENVWACALHQIGYEMYGIDVDQQEIVEAYGVTEDELSDVCQQIKYIEEISNLQI